METALSIIAIIISLFAIGLELLNNQRLNRVNLEAKFFEQIYNDFLLFDFPNARNKMTYNNNVVGNTDEMENLLNEIRKKSIFFKFRDRKYYNHLCERLQKFEDELVSKGDKTLSYDEFYDFQKYVNDSIEEIYDIIVSKYTGKISIRLKK